MTRPSFTPHLEAIAAFREAFGDRISTSMAVRLQHCGTETYHSPFPPEAVLFLRSTEEVQRAVRLAAVHRMPLVPFGAGTSLEGHLAALRGGVCLDLSGMNRILSVRESDLDVSVEAGVTREQLNTFLRATGLFFAVDPGANATIGGMAATRASGTNAVRYGTMRENVLGLTVVLADGRVIHTGSRARKSAAGYDLTRLFVGSEGTLGILTEVTVRLFGIPEHAAAGTCAFGSIEDAVGAVVTTIQSGVPIARIELLDAFSIAAFNAFSGLSLAVSPTLFIELNGSVASVADQVDTVRDIFSDAGGMDIRFASSADERDGLWRARHQMHYALLAQRPGSKSWSTDACVPISRLPECIASVSKEISAAPFPVSLVGHVGDGNFHLGFLLDTEDPLEMAAAAELSDRVVASALACGGTCTGEHGVGYGKAKFMQSEHGEALDIMKAIKHTLDPSNILNPGKMWPDEDHRGSL